MEEIIKTLETREEYYRNLVDRPRISAYSQAIYKRKVDVANHLRKAFQVRLTRRKSILKNKEHNL